MKLRVAAVGTGRGFLAYQRGGSHLSARHAVDGIIDEDDDDVLATVQGVNGLTRSNARQVTVTLIGEHQAVRPAALDARSQCGSTSVGSFLPVNVNIVVGKHGAAYGTYAYGLVLHSHFLYDFGNELMHYTVRAARAVVHVIVVQERRLLADDVLRLNYLISIHNS